MSAAALRRPEAGRLTLAVGIKKQNSFGLQLQKIGIVLVSGRRRDAFGVDDIARYRQPLVAGLIEPLIGAIDLRYFELRHKSIRVFTAALEAEPRLRSW